MWTSSGSGSSASSTPTGTGTGRPRRSSISFRVLSFAHWLGVPRRVYLLAVRASVWRSSREELSWLREDVQAGVVVPPTLDAMPHERTTRVRLYAGRSFAVVGSLYVLAAFVQPSAGRVAVAFGFAVGLAVLAGRRVRRGLNAYNAATDDDLMYGDLGAAGFTRSAGRLRRRPGVVGGAADGAAGGDDAPPMTGPLP